MGLLYLYLYSFLLETESIPGIKSIKNSNNSIGNRTRDLPASRPGPPPTAPPLYIETTHSFPKSDGDILNAAILQTLDAG